MTTLIKTKIKKSGVYWQIYSSCKCKKSTCLIWTYGHFDNNYRVATLSTLSLTVSGIIIPSLKSIGQF